MPTEGRHEFDENGKEFRGFDGSLFPSTSNTFDGRTENLTRTTNPVVTDTLDKALDELPRIADERVANENFV